MSLIYFTKYSIILKLVSNYLEFQYVNNTLTLVCKTFYNQINKPDFHNLRTELSFTFKDINNKNIIDPIFRRLQNKMKYMKKDIPLKINNKFKMRYKQNNPFTSKIEELSKSIKFILEYKDTNITEYDRSRNITEFDRSCNIITKRYKGMYYNKQPTGPGKYEYVIGRYGKQFGIMVEEGDFIDGKITGLIFNSYSTDFDIFMNLEDKTDDSNRFSIFINYSELYCFIGINNKDNTKKTGVVIYYDEIKIGTFVNNILDSSTQHDIIKTDVEKYIELILYDISNKSYKEKIELYHKLYQEYLVYIDFDNKDRIEKLKNNSILKIDL